MRYTVTVLMFFFMGLSPLGAFGSDRPTDRSAEAVKKAILSRGPESTLADETVDPSAWLLILNNIKEGSAAWLEVAGLLRPKADAAASSDLDLAVAGALASNPEGTLQFLNQPKSPFEVENVCGTVEKDLVDEDERPALEKQRKAIGSVKPGDSLAGVRKRCLKLVSSALAQLPPVECSRIKTEIANEIEFLRKCKTDNDCKLVTGRCPFGCYFFLNKGADKKTLEALFLRYTSNSLGCGTCVNDCKAAPKVISCIEGRCAKSS